MDGALRSFVDLRFGMFLHFSMGTFHDAEWVAPGQDPARFPARAARYVRLEATATHGGGPAVASEIECGALAARPEVV